jgi:hypothetical protein
LLVVLVTLLCITVLWRNNHVAWFHRDMLGQLHVVPSEGTLAGDRETSTARFNEILDFRDHISLYLCNHHLPVKAAQDDIRFCAQDRSAGNQPAMKRSKAGW